ncbi:MAG: tripartite tricarboxylate transporter TctB family protein [Kineothrix sp.]|nr:tripartite tricarboxylate transporter TctB family protein [Kineothrix sp.]NBI89387.1 hypothetical protein [Lachnospiraceae bacterium]
MGELIFLGILAIIGVIMFGMSFGFQTSLLDKSGGPALYPRIVIVVLVIFLVVRCVMIIRSQEELKKKFHFLEILQGSRLIYLLLLLGYAVIIKPLGFVISSVIFAVIAVTFLHKKQYGTFITGKKAAVLYPIMILSIVALYYVFTNYFNVLLPGGILDF